MQEEIDAVKLRSKTVFMSDGNREDHPGDFKRLANERLATPTPEIEI
jgi:hypothetical protein